MHRDFKFFNSFMYQWMDIFIAEIKLGFSINFIAFTAFIARS